MTREKQCACSYCGQLGNHTRKAGPHRFCDDQCRRFWLDDAAEDWDRLMETEFRGDADGQTLYY